MYAIVDIETTGGYASANGITEVAIVLHNGIEVEGKFHTLINPGVPIPRYITSLTGISNEMVYAAPRFEEVAANIYQLLSKRIFVAHNVNFDYSFLKHHLQATGFELNTKKLCTVRMSRKAFPGWPSYSLGNLCRQLQITIENRHRAMGDVLATVQVFEKIVKEYPEGLVDKMVKGRNKEQYLPPHLPAEQVEQLPTDPGVYYFHNKKGKIIYIGKATNLRQRVKSHFSNNDDGKRKQQFLLHIYSVSYKLCASELSALILESVEIRKWWPQYNRSQKKYHYEYGLYTFEDQNGYQRLFIERKKKQLPVLYTFNLLHEGQVLLRRLVQEFELNEGLCFIDRSGEAALVTETPESYNNRVKKAITSLQEKLPSFLVVDNEGELNNYILMEKGKFAGMGTLAASLVTASIDTIKELITPYPDNDYIRGLIYQFVEKFPDKKIEIFS
jgi:DNA polymerase III subunit epsilon